MSGRIMNTQTLAKVRAIVFDFNRKRVRFSVDNPMNGSDMLRDTVRGIYEHDCSEESHLLVLLLIERMTGHTFHSSNQAAEGCRVFIRGDHPNFKAWI